MTQERHPSTSAERDRIKEEASVALRRALTGRSFRPELFLGTRESAGKALLDELAPEGEALGFLVSRLDVGEETFAVQIFREGKSCRFSATASIRPKIFSVTLTSLMRHWRIFSKRSAAAPGRRTEVGC